MKFIKNPNFKKIWILLSLFPFSVHLLRFLTLQLLHFRMKQTAYMEECLNSKFLKQKKQTKLKFDDTVKHLKFIELHYD